MKLFDWKEAYFGFNPCFSGSCFRIPIGLEYLRLPTHVSILVLVDLAFEFLISSHELKEKTVSILVLVDLAFEFIDMRYYSETHEFQSLFQWILLSNTTNKAALLTLYIVSILVLVDLAFE